MAARLVRLLEAALAAPDRAIGSLDILAPAERHTILREWNDTAHPVPDATLPQLFAAQAARTPDAVAVVFEDTALTYAELDARANQLAHHLQGLGVGPEVVVGLCVERSLEMVVALLGILKAGGAYLPLDPGYPAERLAYMLADARVDVLVTQSALLDRIGRRMAARIVRLDADWPAIAQQPAIAPAVAVDPHNTAYVIYTSGSTGMPKGVVVTHGGMRNRLAAMQSNLRRSLTRISYCRLHRSSFDASRLGDFVAAYHWSAVWCLPRRAMHRDPARSGRDNSSSTVSTTLHCVPSMLLVVLDSRQRSIATASGS